MPTSLPTTQRPNPDQYGSELEKNTTPTQPTATSSNTSTADWSSEPWNLSATPTNNSFETKANGINRSSDWSSDPATLASNNKEASLTQEKHSMGSHGSLSGFKDGSSADTEKMTVFKKVKILESLAISAKAGEKIMQGAGEAVMATSEATMDLIYQIFGIEEKKEAPPTQVQVENKARASVIKRNITQQEADQARMQNQKQMELQKDQARILGRPISAGELTFRTGVSGGEVGNISSIIFAAAKEDPAKQAVKKEPIVLPGSGKGKTDHNNQRGAMEDANNVMNRVG